MHSSTSISSTRSRTTSLAVYPEAEVTITGSNVLYVKMFQNVITTMAKSYVISLSVITVLMILLLGRLRIGLLSMVPNLLPLVMILGIMGWMDIPLDMSTVLIGSIAIGLVVDDTIHFMHNFRRDFEELGSVNSGGGQNPQYCRARHSHHQRRARRGLLLVCRIRAAQLGDLWFLDGDDGALRAGGRLFLHPGADGGLIFGRKGFRRR